MFKKILLFLLVALLVLVGVVLFRTFTFESKQPTVEAVTPVNIEAATLDRLSQAIQLRTISYDEPSRFNPEPFIHLHALINSSFPLVDSLLTKEIINEYSLLYSWTGKNPDAEPIVLMAHMDVVPIEDSSVWTEPPFSGKNDGQFIWGRGTLDDKMSVFGLLEAAEMLLQQGFQPERTIYFAFGHDEEISGHQGAETMAKLLEERGIKAQFVLDEGMVIGDGLVPGIDQPVALIGIAEKGYVSLQLQTHIEGGHSSMPDKENSIATIAEALDKLYKNPFPRRLSEPVEQFVAYTGPEMPFVQKMAFANMWLFKPVFFNALGSSASGNASLRTTTSPTIFHSGVKENLIPAEASAVVNFRILPGETPDDVVAYVNQTIDNPKVKVTIMGWANAASPVSTTESAGFNTIVISLKQVFPNTIVSPMLVIGATDSRYFSGVSSDVYRMAPVTLNGDDLARIHGIDERIGVEDYKNLIRFYYQLMLNVQ